MKNIIYSTKANPFFVTLLLSIVLGANACQSSISEERTQPDIVSESTVQITEQEVLEAQRTWSEGIIQIGKTYTEGGDYTLAATQLIDALYAYDLGPVLFKPTLASIRPFRTDKEGALSYFVGGNPDYMEDHGFAIKPWSQVRWESLGLKIIGNMAVAMGHYYFMPAQGGEEVKVDYSFAYTKDNQGNIRIILHDSHLPYTPEKGH